MLLLFFCSVIFVQFLFGVRYATFTLSHPHCWCCRCCCCCPSRARHQFNCLWFGIGGNVMSMHTDIGTDTARLPNWCYFIDFVSFLGHGMCSSVWVATTLIAHTNRFQPRRVNRWKTNSKHDILMPNIRQSFFLLPNEKRTHRAMKNAESEMFWYDTW